MKNKTQFFKELGITPEDWEHFKYIRGISIEDFNEEPTIVVDNNPSNEDIRLISKAPDMLIELIDSLIDLEVKIAHCEGLISDSLFDKADRKQKLIEQITNRKWLEVKEIYMRCE